MLRKYEEKIDQMRTVKHFKQYWKYLQYNGYTRPSLEFSEFFACLGYVLFYIPYILILYPLVVCIVHPLRGWIFLLPKWDEEKWLNYARRWRIDDDSNK